MTGDLDSWKAARLAALSAPDGWLNLTDRVELPPGELDVGTAEGNAIRLSCGPPHLGRIAIGEDGATFSGPDRAPASFEMAPGGFPQLKVGHLILEIHTVGGQPALRVRDLNKAREVALRYFPADPDWVITADWRKLAAPEDRTIAQKGGPETGVTLTHRAVFRRGGGEFTLSPTHWKAGLPMFVIRDATSGRETYAASRFLIPDEIGETTITLDFNRLHNPPCAFTQFAICPLPPPENVLPFAIRAGELAL